MTSNENSTEFSECFKEAKARLTISDLWDKLGLEGEPSKKCKSPFRDDNRASFSITKEGRYWKDHGTGDCGDIFDFYQKAMDCTKADAVREVFKMLNMKSENPGYGWSKAPPKKAVVCHSHNEKAAKFVECCMSLPPEAVEYLLSKGISLFTTEALIAEGSIDFEANKLIYVYNTGKKMRCSWETSKDNRWIEGGAEDALWRYEQVIRPEVTTVLICEGESDCMRVLSTGPIPVHVAVVAAPAASWRPSDVLCSTIGHGRKVVLAFDNDEAGENGAKEVARRMEEACSYNVDIQRWPWSHIDNVLQLTGKEPVKDLCELGQTILLKILDAAFEES